MWGAISEQGNKKQWSWSVESPAGQARERLPLQGYERHVNGLNRGALKKKLK